jgi:ankyrin repeat protein
MNEGIKNSVAKAFTINSSISQDFITQSSLEYIQHCAKSQAEYGLLPLIEYASSHWGRHLSCISSDHNEQACQLAFSIFNDMDLASFWLSIERDKFQPEPLGRGTRLYPTANFWKCYPLWVSVTSGILRLSELFLSANSPVEDMPTIGCFLDAAVRRKDVLMVKLLLKHRANPAGALLSAIEAQKDDIIQELISHNIRATPREFVRAAGISSGNAIKAILSTAEDIGYGDLAIALGESLINHDGRLTEILMSDLTNSSGRFPNKHQRMQDRDYIYWHLNRHAASNDLPEVVTLLAGSRSSFPISTHNLEFVLMIAAEAGHSRVARAVLSAPGLIWSTDALTSAAITATRGTHDRVVREIASHLSSRDITECKLLHVAISVGCQPVIHWLLVGKRRSHGSGYWNDDKALLLAALRDDDATVTKLLSNGATRASLDSLADANVRRQLIEEMFELGSGSGKIDSWRLVAGDPGTAMDYQFNSASVGLTNAQLPESMSLVSLRAEPSPGSNSMALVLQNGMSQLKMALLRQDWQCSLFMINDTLRKAGLMLDVEFTRIPSGRHRSPWLRQWLPTGNMFITHMNCRPLLKISVRDMAEKRQRRRRLIGPSRPPSGLDAWRFFGRDLTHDSTCLWENQVSYYILYY